MEHFRANLRRSLNASWSLFFAAPVVTVVLAIAVWVLSLWLQSGKWGFILNALAGLAWTLVSTLIVFGALFLVHFLYLIPKRMIAETESQLKDAEDRAKTVANAYEAQLQELRQQLDFDRLPANRAHVALDRLYELGREGKAMLERLKRNLEPTPTPKDVDVWADKLASIGSSVGSYADKGSFKVHYRYLSVAPIVLDVTGVPAANVELAKSIQAKLSLKTELIARLLREDMISSLNATT
jgi:hypothetical protein